MRKIIENLRKKDQYEKDKIAFLGALVMTACIAMFWVLGITTTSSKDSDSQLANAATPFESIKQDFVNLFEEFKK